MARDTVPLPAWRRRTFPVAAVVAAALVVGLGATACTGDDWPVQGEGAPGIDESINGDVLEYLGDNDLPGATVAVTRAGRLVWSKAYGWANKSEQIRMKPWHRSRIGSVSKVITAIGLLRLLESGEGDLGSLAAGSRLQAGLTRKLYGHPGMDFDSPGWPTVTGPTLLDDPEVYWEAMRIGVQNAYPDTFPTEMATTIEWASTLDARHLLTHTASYILSGDPEGAAAYFGDEWDDTYGQTHQFNLSGQRQGDEGGDSVKCWLDGEYYVDKEDPAYSGQDYLLPPLLNEPGTKRCYSNHGFGVAGMAIDDLAGPGATYLQVIRQNMLEPLGLTDVVPKNTDINEDLDAWPHGSALDPDDLNLLGTAAGGWSASARDLVRIMCGLDRTSNNLRLLTPQTVTTMETVVFPEASGSQPLGWDSIVNGRLYKNGIIGGGRSVIIKYLPGKFDAAPDDEINIAVNVNSSGALPPENLLSSIAAKVAAADIADDYDLFDPDYACVVEDELGLVNPTPAPTTAHPGATLVNPTPAPTTPRPGATLVNPTPAPTTHPAATRVAPTPTRTSPTPPTVHIRQPVAGQHRAPRGMARLTFSGLARDAHGALIPGTYYRWTARQGATKTLLCAGSGIGTGAPPTTIGGLTAKVDCTSFTKSLPNPFPSAGPPITIELEARDPAGIIGSATVVVVLVTPPVG
jgi:CubicO group peptidase (beta-lactamase class C family)